MSQQRRKAAETAAKAEPVVVLTPAEREAAKAKAKSLSDWVEQFTKSMPAALSDIVAPLAAHIEAEADREADNIKAASAINEVWKGMTSNVAAYFAPAYAADVADPLAVYKPLRLQFDAACAVVFKGSAVAADSRARAVRRLLSDAKVKRPESVDPASVKRRAIRQAGSILGAAEFGDPEALAKAIKAAPAELVETLRANHAEQFATVEVHAARKARLLKFIDGLLPDSPSFVRLWEAALLLDGFAPAETKPEAETPAA